MKYIKNNGLLGDLDEPVFGLDKALQFTQTVVYAVGAISFVIAASFAFGYFTS